MATKRGNPNWKKGKSKTGGRKKGSTNKIPRTVKENIEEAFEKIGDVAELVKWAKKSNRNQERFYDWYFSMLPKNVDVKGRVGVDILSVSEMKKSVKEYKKDGS